MMPATLPLEIPSADTLRRLREELGISQAELAAELGFKSNGADVVRAWEHGTRNGAPYHPTPLAWRCFRLMVAVCRAVNNCESGLTYLRAHLSEILQ